MFAQSHDPPAFLQKSGEVYEKIIQIARETRIMPRFLMKAGIAEIRVAIMSCKLRLAPSEPASDSFSIVTICDSLNLFFFISSLLFVAKFNRKLYFQAVLF
jgi:hypothetical protein